MVPNIHTLRTPPRPPTITSKPLTKYRESTRPRSNVGITAAEKISEMRKMRRILGLLSAMMIVGMMMTTVIIRTQISGSLLRNISFDKVDTMADCRLSKTAQLRQQTMTMTKPTTQLGSVATKLKNARPP